MATKAIDRPLEVERVDGEVVITGPDGINGSLTVDAARETAKRLSEALGDANDNEIYQKPLG